MLLQPRLLHGPSRLLPLGHGATHTKNGDLGLPTLKRDLGEGLVSFVKERQEAGALILVIDLLIAAAVGLVAILPYAYSWLYDMVRNFFKRVLS